MRHPEGFQGGTCAPIGQCGAEKVVNDPLQPLTKEELEALIGAAGRPGTERAEVPARLPGPAAGQIGTTGSWDHGPRALRTQGVLRPRMQDCYHLPRSMCDCSSSPALSKVAQATAQPPQGVAHVKPDDDHPQNFQEKWPGSLTEG
ncbi:E3 ubiquitin-protein ligase MARCHF2 [Manis pentadactyla]|uniref:E3 ubiquitin-protein ligase MARCHF2 n=1 Tax=Manis pentadactyla TaxID=143292 RepID=UPI00255C6E71|nr:E3 ubiquitin-protein ligase MARCHF2 [Manis pentadactyla]